MTWVKIDDGFFLHPKAIAAGRDGRDIFLAAICWSNQQMTDGIVPAHTLPLIAALAGVADYDQAAQKLCDAGLWANHVEGWEIHQFLDHQQSKEQREEWLKKDRERKKAARDAKRMQEDQRNLPQTSTRTPPGIQTDSALESSSRGLFHSSSIPSSSSSGPLSSAAEPAAETTDDEDRASRAIEELGRADHTKALADGVAIRNKQAHLEECIRRRNTDRSAAIGLATQHPDWDHQRIAGHILDPEAEKRKAARARIDKALGA